MDITCSESSLGEGDIVAGPGPVWTNWAFILFLILILLVFGISCGIC